VVPTLELDTDADLLGAGALEREHRTTATAQRGVGRLDDRLDVARVDVLPAEDQDILDAPPVCRVGRPVQPFQVAERLHEIIAA